MPPPPLLYDDNNITYSYLPDRILKYSEIMCATVGEIVKMCLLDLTL